MNKSESGVVSPAIIALIVIVLIGIVGYVAFTVYQNNSNEQVGSSSQVRDNATYEDGEYSAVGTYISPGGPASVDLTVTIENNVIVASNLSGQSSSDEARGYINQFIDGYAVEVVGKNVDEVELTRVAGSSLTSIGFNNALEDIRNQAQS